MLASRHRRLSLGAAALALVCVVGLSGAAANDRAAGEEAAKMVRTQYLEIVTPEVDKTCALIAASQGVEFGDPIPEFGGARTAALAGGGEIGVRGPLRPDERPVVRPYLLVDDIAASVASAEAAGAEIAIPPMEIPGRGRFAIYILGGIEHGLWQK